MEIRVGTLACPEKLVVRLQLIPVLAADELKTEKREVIVLWLVKPHKSSEGSLLLLKEIDYLICGKVSFGGGHCREKLLVDNPQVDNSECCE